MENNRTHLFYGIYLNIENVCRPIVSFLVYSQFWGLKHTPHPYETLPSRISFQKRATTATDQLHAETCIFILKLFTV